MSIHPIEHHPTTHQLHRRTVLGIGAGLAAAGSAFSVFGPPAAHAQDEYELMRQRYAELLCGPSDADMSHPAIQDAVRARDAVMATHLGNITDQSDRVFSDLPLTDLADDESAMVQSTSLQLSTMAKVWGTPTSEYHQDSDVAETIVTGLQKLCELQYHEGHREFGNWYHWEIGAPRGIVDTASIMGDHVPDELRQTIAAAIEWYIPDPNYNYPPYHPDGQKWNNGSNRLEMCLYAIVGAILGRQPERIELGATAAPIAYEYVTEESGFYRDGSFLYHVNVPYTGSYGRALVLAASLILPLLSGTTWEIPPEGTKPLMTGVERCIRPWVYNAQTLSGVLGRAVSRSNVDAYGVMSAVLALAEGAEPDLRTHWYGVVKGWMERDAQDAFFEQNEVIHAIYAARLAASPVEALPEPVGSHLFPEMDRFTHRQSGWCVSVSTASFRTRRWEVMSGENLKCWHQSAGTRYLHIDEDLGQYVSNWFPTMDPLRFPGTTVDALPQEDMSGGLPAWPGDERKIGPVGIDHVTGGTSVGGRREDDGFYVEASNAVWVHHTQPWNSTGFARLAWFTLADGVVCLGSGITAGDSGHPMESILDQRMVLIDAARTWYADGQPVPGSDELGWEDELSGVRALTLPGVESFIALGEPFTVRMKHEERQGAWRDINTGRSATVHTGEYQTAWLDHGADAKDAAFAYLLAPGLSAADAHRRSQSPGVTVLANTAELQAVRAGDFTGLVFHSAGELRDRGVTVVCPDEVTVALLRSKDGVEVAVSDPTQQDRVLECVITIPGLRSYRIEHADDGISHTSERNDLRLTINSDAGDGGSYRLELRR